jgi:hypothetical protein
VASNRAVTEDKELDELMFMFDYAYEAVTSHFERMENLQAAHDNSIDTYRWPTISEISIPITFISVQKQLPFALKYLFPKKNFLRLIPERHAVTTERLQAVAENLRHTVIVDMEMERYSLLSIKDCYKFGVGYGMIDVQEITPPTIDTTQFFEDGQLSQSVTQMAMGQPVRVPVYRYIPAGQVVPMPDGADVEGPNKASGHFVVDIMYEDAFRRMYRDHQTLEGTQPRYKGDPDAIIKEAKSMNLDARMMTSATIRRISGLDMNDSNNGHDKMPVVIPIVKYYGDHKQVWMALGRHKIWKQESTFQTMTSDLVKWSAWPDGNRWFPLSVTEASSRLAYGQNVYYNAMMDLMMYYLNPTRVLNEQMLGSNKSPDRGPRADIKVKGDARAAVQFVTPPPAPSQLYEMGQILQRYHGQAQGHPSFLDDASAGLVRGGTNALETLLQSSTARQLLAAAILKAGGLKPAVERTLIKKQLLIDDNGSTTVAEIIDDDTGEVSYVDKTITREDLHNIFRVELDLPVARWNSAAALAERSAMFDRAQKTPEFFDQMKLWDYFAEDDQFVKHTMLPKNVVKARAERKAEAAIAAQERGGPEDQGAAPATEGQQAAEGAGALAGAALTGGVQ